MWIVPTEVWLPLATLILGYVGSLVTEWVRDSRAATREARAQDQARTHDRVERRNEFQRQTLLSMQEAVFDLVRSVGALHTEDLVTHQRTGKWNELGSDEWNEKNMVANRMNAMLSARVLDDNLREQIERLRTAATRVLLARSKQESEKEMDNMVALFEHVNGRVGEILRSLY
jgi:hypothetical protein